MSILLNDEALCCGARRLAVQLAAALPAPEDGFSPAFQADMTALTRCVTRRQAVRRWGRRAAAAHGPDQGRPDRASAPDRSCPRFPPAPGGSFWK